MEITQKSTVWKLDKENMLYTYNGILFNLKKEGNPAICNNVDGPTRTYAKWNKSDKERQALYDTTYMQNCKKPNSEKQKVE